MLRAKLQTIEDGAKQRAWRSFKTGKLHWQVRCFIFPVKDGATALHAFPADAFDVDEFPFVSSNQCLNVKPAFNVFREGSVQCDHV